MAIYQQFYMSSKIFFLSKHKISLFPPPLVLGISNDAYTQKLHPNKSGLTIHRSGIFIIHVNSYSKYKQQISSLECLQFENHRAEDFKT